VSNLLAQRKEIKRLGIEQERQKREEEEEATERAEEEKERAVNEFEKVMMGLEGGPQKKSTVHLEKDRDEPIMESKGVKRKFELNEEEMLKNAREDRAKARKALDDEKVKTSKPAFHF